MENRTIIDFCFYLVDRISDIFIKLIESIISVTILIFVVLSFKYRDVATIDAVSNALVKLTEHRILFVMSLVGNVVLSLLIIYMHNEKTRLEKRMDKLLEKYIKE